MPCPSPSKSPIIEAFKRGVKHIKSPTPNSFDSSTLRNKETLTSLSSCTKFHENITPQKTVMRDLFLSKESSLRASLNNKVKKKLGAEEHSVEANGRFSLENSTEQKVVCKPIGVVDSEGMWSQAPKTILKDRGKGSGNLENISLQHQRLKSSLRMSRNLTDPDLQIAVEATHANVEERGFNPRWDQSLQQSWIQESGSFSGVGNISPQKNGSLAMNGHGSVQQDFPVGSAPCIQHSVPRISLPEKMSGSESVMIKNNSFSVMCSHGRISSCPLCHSELAPHGKRKRTSGHSGFQSMGHSEGQISESYLHLSGEKIKNTKRCTIDSMVNASDLGGPDSKIANLRTNDCSVSNVSLESNTHNSRRFGSLNIYPSLQVKATARHCHHNIAEHSKTTSVLAQSSEMSRLPDSSDERSPYSGSAHLQTKTCSRLHSLEQMQLRPYLSVTGSTSPEPQDTNCMVAPPLVEQSSLSSQCCGTLNCKGDFMSALPSPENPGKPLLLSNIDGSFTSHSSEDEFRSRDFLPSPNEEVLKRELVDDHKPNGRLQDSLDSDDSFECNLDSDDADELLQPLQEIMQNASKPPTATPEKACFEIFSSQESITPSNTQFTSTSPVTYTNSLDRLLREKEDSKRLDDLEQKLKGDIEQGMGIFCPFADEPNTDEEGTLSEEHRAFINKYSVVTDAIPDLHPGEEIFHLSDSGKLFNQHTLDLNDFGFVPHREEEKLILSAGKKQQIILVTQGFLSLLYRFVQCPTPILKWLFQMMSVHSDYIVSVQILNTLMDVTVSSFSTSDVQFRPWMPSVLDVSVVFLNMGIPFTSLFSLECLQPEFKEEDILFQMSKSVNQDENQQGPKSQAFSSLPETNIINIIKFLGLCTAVCPEHYKDHEIIQLLILLFKIRLEKQLKQIPLIDIHCLLESLLKSIRAWDVKMNELCLCISKLSSHHHNLLKLVHLVPNSIARGRELRKRLSLLIISKLLDKKYECLPEEKNLQMSLLCRYIIQMKPSTLTKKMLAEEIAKHQNDFPEQFVYAKTEQEAYYLTYSLLNLVSEASYLDVCLSNERTFILNLSTALEKHVKCDIREDARLFYKTKVKDLVARISGTWQELLNNSKPNKGKLHDYWEPCFESQSPTSTGVDQAVKAAETFPLTEDIEEMTQDTKSI
ncbi:SMC5-SMC6 complex localization factor protein 2 isoform X2 [Lissotriton helveticus]